MSSIEISDETYHVIGMGAKAFKDISTSEAVIYGILPQAPVCQNEFNREMTGVNTGFGGSADTRTQAADKLKEDLLSGLQYGIFAKAITTNVSLCSDKDRRDGNLQTSVLPLDHEIKTVTPESWVRACMLVRLNSLARGASGIFPATVRALLRLLNDDVIPRVPLRGSISASGDLSPLAYIAGVLEGKPSLDAYVGARLNSERQLERADVALRTKAISPVALTARESLALVNGTSMSAAVAALAIHEALNLAALSQVLTAMSVEALHGTDESFDPFFAAVRPHWGQAEASRNIYAMLDGSKLVNRQHGLKKASLFQDRYSIRTASQWLGPVLEDLSLANSQIATELNSATDNPLVDTSQSPPRLVHGGNFQAKAITSAVEKIRQSAQSIGRILFAQCTELINPATSRGLPPNLVAGEPSESFIFKGTDILIASLISELGFLSNPVASHVQTAEMGNQAINSLALVSARYTLDSLELLSQLSAAHLVAVCQALDLRALHTLFLESIKPNFCTLIREDLHPHLIKPEDTGVLADKCWNAFTSRLDATTSLDSTVRLAESLAHLQVLIVPLLVPGAESLNALRSHTVYLRDLAVGVWRDVREQYLINGEATSLLGLASKRMYIFVRKNLRIPVVGPDTLAIRPYPARLGKGVTTGALNSEVRAAMADGRLYSTVVGCIKDVAKQSKTEAKL